MNDDNDGVVKCQKKINHSTKMPLGSSWSTCLCQVCLKDGALPDEFEKILSCQEDWHKLPLYKLKLLRYVLTVHNQVRRLKDPEVRTS